MIRFFCKKKVLWFDFVSFANNKAKKIETIVMFFTFFFLFLSVRDRNIKYFDKR
jgi:hypothetical protein